MTKPFSVFLIAAFVFLNQPALGGDGKTSGGENKYVEAAFSLSAKSVKPGGKGELEIRLKPKAGIHINLTPAVTVTLDSLSGSLTPGTPDIPKAPKTEYLDTSRPIRQPFTLSRAVKPGPLTLKGVVTYFYCSGADGWCSRFKQPIEVTLTVVP